MKTLSKTAETVFRAAIAKAQQQATDGHDEPYKLDAGHKYMPLCVELIGHVPTRHSLAGEAPAFPLYSFAHYYEQNGDAMRDPDITMIDTPAGLIPISFRQDGGMPMDKSYVEYADAGTIKGFYKKQQADLASFCTIWANNLKEQQDL